MALFRLSGSCPKYRAAPQWPRLPQFYRGVSASFAAVRLLFLNEHMALRYQTGEEIHRGDRVTYGGNAGVIELVVEALTGEPEEDWLFGTNGAGIMVAEPKVF